MTKQMVDPNCRASLSVLTSIALILLALTILVPVRAESVISDHYHINLAMVNGGERYFRLDDAGTPAPLEAAV